MDLKNALVDAVTETVSEESSLAVAFSGGIDSSLLAQLCNDIGTKVTLLTIGFPGSPDIEFSKVIATRLGLPHKLLELKKEDFHNKQRYISQKLGCGNISHIENCIAFFYLGMLARQNGLRLILTANGSDELFCGYDRFRSIYKYGNARIMQLIHEKIENEIILMKEVESITAEFGIKTKHPFLSEKFISIALEISIDNKIKGCDDFIRKHILREVAVTIGVPHEAAREAQEGYAVWFANPQEFQRLKNIQNCKY